MDKIVTIGSSTVHHGKHNNRAYIMSFDKSDGSAALETVEVLAQKEGYTKIVAKIPETKLRLFEMKNYRTEGTIKNSRNERFYFVAKYLSDKRKHIENLTEIKEIIKAAEESGPKEEPAGFVIRRLTEGDIEDQIKIYKAVFKSYPFPIYDKGFIKETMKDSVNYYGVFEDGEMIATSSADIDRKTGCAEMTDFATLPSHRGRGFAPALLEKMEEDLAKAGVRSYFTIARSVSYGMNKTFARAGYEYSGTLYNNTNINGGMESMNIWYKVV